MTEHQTEIARALHLLDYARSDEWRQSAAEAVDEAREILRSVAGVRAHPHSHEDSCPTFCPGRTPVSTSPASEVARG